MVSPRFQRATTSRPTRSAMRKSFSRAGGAPSTVATIVA